MLSIFTYSFETTDIPGTVQFESNFPPAPFVQLYTFISVSSSGAIISEYKLTKKYLDLEYLINSLPSLVLTGIS